MKLVHNSYGKGRVRISKIVRHPDHHDYINYQIQITLEGELETAYTEGDNSGVLPTDTMKNTVYALADQHDFESPEAFAKILANHYLGQVDHLTRVTIDLSEHRWQRVNGDHPHAFTGSDGTRRTVQWVQTRTEGTCEAGIKDFLLLKTTKSGFVGFFKDQYTILPEETDRIMATNMTAHWSVGTELSEADYNASWAAVCDILVSTFADHDSLSVQHTLYAMGEAVLAQRPEVGQIYLSMPNVHNIPFDLSRIGLENTNSIFVPIDEPHGMIEGLMTR